MNSKTTTQLITRKNKNSYETNRKFLLCCTRPPGTPLVAVNMNMNKAGSVRSVWGCADELKEPAFRYVAAGEKQGRVLPATAKEALNDGGEYESDDAEMKDGKRKKKKGGGKKLLRIFKAMLFETSVAKKLKKRKLIKKQKQASKGATLPAKPQKSESFNESSIGQETMDIGSGRMFSPTTSSSLGFSSNSSAITSSSRCSSSLASNSKCSSNKSFSDRIKSFSDKTKSFSERNKAFPDKTKLFPGRNKSFRLSRFERVIPVKEKQENMQLQEHGKGCYSPNIGLCFILISLFVLVLWGKCCAIFCTSTWLFLVPRWTIAKNPSENLVIHSPQLDSDYKEKITLRGLFQRHNSRNR